jgi:hypothetical protein
MTGLRRPHSPALPTTRPIPLALVEGRVGRRPIQEGRESPFPRPRQPARSSGGARVADTECRRGSRIPFPSHGSRQQPRAAPSRGSLPPVPIQSPRRSRRPICLRTSPTMTMPGRRHISEEPQVLNQAGEFANGPADAASAGSRSHLTARRRCGWSNPRCTSVATKGGFHGSGRGRRVLARDQPFVPIRTA